MKLIHVVRDTRHKMLRVRNSKHYSQNMCIALEQWRRGTLIIQFNACVYKLCWPSLLSWIKYVRLRAHLIPIVQGVLIYWVFIGLLPSVNCRPTCHDGFDKYDIHTHTMWPALERRTLWHKCGFIDGMASHGPSVLPSLCVNSNVFDIVQSLNIYRHYVIGSAIKCEFENVIRSSLMI